MGWCHEFGPQIIDGCDHPMVAGATSCTCQECGAECKGRFAGCVDVWARGPRDVEVRATTLRPTQAGVGQAAVGQAAERGSGDDGLRLLIDELIGRCEAAEAKAGEVDVLARAQAAFETTSQADDEMSRRLEQLSARLETLESLPPADPAPAEAELSGLVDRVAALESAPPGEPRVPAEVTTQLDQLAGQVAALGNAPQAEPRVPAALVQQMELLVGQVTALDGTTKRVAALEGIPDRLATLEQSITALESNPVGAGPNHDLEAAISHLGRLSEEVAPLRAVPKRVEAIERVQGRVNTIDKSLATLKNTLGALSDRVEASATPTVEPETMRRIDTLDTSLAELVQTVSQLSSQVAGLDEVPKRVEALEQASSPLEKVVASLAKRVDRLSTQAAAVKELPERLEALERAVSDDRRVDQTTEQVREIAGEMGVLRSTLEALAPRLQALNELSPRLQALEEATMPAEAADQLSDRSEVLARGLGHAIDMIDQLAHQVAVLEESVPASENATA